MSLVKHYLISMPIILAICLVFLTGCSNSNDSLAWNK